MLLPLGFVLGSILERYVRNVILISNCSLLSLIPPTQPQMHRHLCETHRHLCETHRHTYMQTYMHRHQHRHTKQRHRYTHRDTGAQTHSCKTQTQVDTHRPMHRHTRTDTHTQRPSRCLPQAAFSRGFIWRLWANGPGWGELAAAAAWEEEPAVPIDVPACASAFCPDPVLGSQADRHGPLLVKRVLCSKKAAAPPGSARGLGHPKKESGRPLIYEKSEQEGRNLSHRHYQL